MKSKEEIKINAKIIRIKSLNFTQNDIQDDQYIENNIFKLDFNTKLQFGYNKEANEFIIFVDVVSYVKELDLEFSKIKVENAFEINSFGIDLDFENISEEGVNIPDFVINSLVEASISNVRGMLVERFRGTIFQNEILPLISFSNFKES
ncbi:hypothetical protein HX049_07945 [Myroides odoratimimus]|uniref:hypothetical protein n=1 Tax=Myroides odoratimimus TaxID=76832 RepID=UPI002576B7A0|nr:hypothetical protein [Myroides odoratimimus]MDM1397105.1 hypothetical protein [Myroides odoratimimus]